MEDLLNRLTLSIKAELEQTKISYLSNNESLSNRVRKAEFFIKEILKDDNAKSLKCYEALKTNFGG